LERLYTCELGLESVPPWYGELTGLRTLDLGHNRLRAVPSLAALTRLEILYLHDNALTALPSLPPSLTYLNVSENPLTELPAFDLPQLLELRCLDLGLTALAPLHTPRLRELHLRTNAFDHVPETIRSMRELRTLDMRANRLTSVPDWLVELPRLEKLDLRWNEVLEVPRALLDRGCFVLLA
jgi:Leucine-rich repeat (LRR) protein